MYDNCIDKYLEKLDCAIAEIIESESRGLTEKGEKLLHALLENRKHVKAWINEKGNPSQSQPMVPNTPR